MVCSLFRLRRARSELADEVYADVLYQIGALGAFLRPFGQALHHVKPHGALYAKMLVHPPTAEAVVTAVHDFDPALPLVGLAGPGGTEFAETATGLGVQVVLEAFPDRGYTDDGRLARAAELRAAAAAAQEAAEEAGAGVGQ